MGLSISLFGPFEARLDDTVLPIRSRRGQAMLAMLALAPSRCVARDRLAATLWPDRSESQAKASLRQELSGLRRALGEASAILSADAHVVRLDNAHVHTETTGRGRAEFLEGLDIRSEPFDDWRRAEAARFEAALDDLPIGGATAPHASAHDALDKADWGSDARATAGGGNGTSAVDPGAAGRDGDGAGDIFDNPALLLLGFVPASGDADDVSFATGLVVDLRTSLGLWRWFPVIGPETVGWKTDRDADMRALAQDASAAYVIGGMIRRSGPAIRVTVSLTEVESGRSVWSDTFDGDMDDVFAMQEAISQAIVARVMPEIERSEAQRVVRRPPKHIRAWQLVAQTEELERTGGEGYGSPEANAAMVPLLEEATRIDPGYSRAWSRLGRYYFRAAMQGWLDDLSGALEKAQFYCEKGVKLDPTEWEGQAYRALTLIFGAQDFGPARHHAMEAVRLNPSAALARHACGCALEWIGEPEASLTHLRVIFELNPSYSNRAAALGDITTCELFVGNLDAAEDAARQLMDIAPDYARGLQRVAMTLGHVGDVETAGHVLARIDTLMPGFDEAYVRKTYPYARPEHVEMILDGLRRAGWTG